MKKVWESHDSPMSRRSSATGIIVNICIGLWIQVRWHLETLMIVHTQIEYNNGSCGESSRKS